MKLRACLFILFISISSFKAENVETYTYSPPPPPPRSKCYQFLMNLTNTSIPAADRSLEANNTLRLSGHNLNDLGDYNHCINLLTQKYNIISMGGATLGIGFCGPSYCTTEELRNITKETMERIHNMTGKDMSGLTPSIIDPQILGIEQGFWFYFSSFLIGILIVLVIAGTISANWSKLQAEKLQSLTFQANQENIREQLKSQQHSAVLDGSISSLQEALLTNKETVHEVVSNETVDIYLKKDIALPTPLLKPKKQEPSLIIRIIECFDLNENFKAYISNRMDPNHDGNLNIFNGVRALCFGWVVYGHSHLSFLLAKNYAYVAMFEKSSWMLVLAAAFYAVDTFFYLSGFFTGFLLLSKLKNLPFGFKSFGMILFHRLIRLWPAYLVTLLFFWKLSVYYGEGALWFGFVKQAQACNDIAWQNLFFVDNIIGKQNSCFGWGWYLSNDIQMFLLAPFICWIYLKNKERGKNIVWILFFISICASYYESVNTGETYVLGPQLKGQHSASSWYDYYANPVVRMSPYALGLLIGFIFREYKNGEYNIFRTLKNSQSKSFFSVLLGIAIILTVTFYPRTVQTGDKWTQGFSMTWNIFGRSLFPLGIFFLTAPGLVGNMKPLTNLMGNYYFTLISRISYTGYLIHYVFLFVTMYNSSQILGFSEGYVMQIAFGVFIFACFGAIIIHLLIEKPLANIETRIISGKKLNKKIVVSNLVKNV